MTKMLALLLVMICTSLQAGVVKTDTIITDKTTTGVSGVSKPLGMYRTFQGFGNVSASTGAATIEIQVSNDCTNYIVIDTLSLTLGTTVTSDYYENQYAWKCVRGNVATISGTNAKVSLIIGGHVE